MTVAPAKAPLRFAITIDHSRDNLLTDFGKATLKDRYLLPGESYQDLFARVACAYADDAAHAQRLYTYMSLLWFMPATPVLANGGTTRGLPISCFVLSVDDSIQGISDTWTESVWLGSRGGGLGVYYGKVRSIGEKAGLAGETSGIMPFLKVHDSLSLAISQGGIRRSAAAIYLDVSHPEIEEFIEMRRPTGGDPNRRSLNLHHAVVIPDTFMQAVEQNSGWNLISPMTGEVIKSVSARDLWIRILTARIETGEPYLFFVDAANRLKPEVYNKVALSIETSQLCNEITLHTGIDYLGNHRSAVCCLSSLNLDYFLDWKSHPTFIEDVMRFLDNVMQDFIDRAPDTMARARYSAMRERSVGLGVMGFHSFLQSLGVPFESAVAKSWNLKMFKHIKEQADAASVTLAHEKGPCPDAADAGLMVRFANKTAIAPTASISIICGGASPGIEPSAANSYAQKTLSGTHVVRNPHLKRVLAKHGKDDAETWTSIGAAKGSVQHLDFLTQQEKDTFKTAIELDQRWLIEHAADRTPFIDQGQSLNLFFAADAHKKDINDVHMMAWKKGLKGLYYCRSLSVQRAETVSEKIAQKTVAPEGEKKYDECLACQ